MGNRGLGGTLAGCEGVIFKLQLTREAPKQQEAWMPLELLNLRSTAKVPTGYSANIKNASDSVLRDIAVISLVRPQ